MAIILAKFVKIISSGKSGGQGGEVNPNSGKGFGAAFGTSFPS